MTTLININVKIGSHVQAATTSSTLLKTMQIIRVRMNDVLNSMMNLLQKKTSLHVQAATKSSTLWKPMQIIHAQVANTLQRRHKERLHVELATKSSIL